MQRLISGLLVASWLCLPVLAEENGSPVKALRKVMTDNKAEARGGALFMETKECRERWVFSADRLAVQLLFTEERSVGELRDELLAHFSPALSEKDRDALNDAAKAWHAQSNGDDKQLQWVKGDTFNFLVSSNAARNVIAYAMPASDALKTQFTTEFAAEIAAHEKYVSKATPGEIRTPDTFGPFGSGRDLESEQSGRKMTVPKPAPQAGPAPVEIPKDK